MYTHKVWEPGDMSRNLLTRLGCIILFIIMMVTVMIIIGTIIYIPLRAMDILYNLIGFDILLLSGCSFHETITIFAAVGVLAGVMQGIVELFPDSELAQIINAKLGLTPLDCTDDCSEERLN